MKAILVLDGQHYKKIQKNIEAKLKMSFSEYEIVYTEYENEFLRKVRRSKVFGNFLAHLVQWWISWRFVNILHRKSRNATIICLNPLVGMLLGFRRKNWTKLIVCGFLFEPKSSKFYYAIRKMLARLSLHRVDKAVVYGSKEVEYYESEFPGVDKFCFVQYGSDFESEMNYKGELPNEYIFSGGGSNRDYETLLKSFSSLQLNKNSRIMPLVVATQSWYLSNLPLDNVIVLDDVINETFGSVMAKSSFVVLSLKDSDISAGHMVMLQALSLGKLVLVNDIPAIRDYVDEQTVVFYKSGSIGDLSEKIQELDLVKYNGIGEEGKRLYIKKFNSLAFIERIISISV